MQYVIEVDEDMNGILSNNAARRNMSVPSLIVEMLKQYAIDAHIMEKEELWQAGITECAAINLDWANL